MLPKTCVNSSEMQCVKGPIKYSDTSSKNLILYSLIQKQQYLYLTTGLFCKATEAVLSAFGAT